MNKIKFLLAIVVCFMLVIACNKQTNDKKIVKEETKYGVNAGGKEDTQDLELVTIDGYDDVTDYIIPRLNVWKDYDTRPFAFSLKHGTKVWMIKRVGDGVKIKTKDGRTGWITYWFIKELKY